VVVTYGDTPVLRGQTLAALAQAHAGHGAAATVLTTVVADPAGYGRVIRDADGEFADIVEEADATPEQRAITEINSGIYAFEAATLGGALKRVATGNVKGEEYLTDVAAILRGDGYHVASVVLRDSDEVQGVNDRAQLAQARKVLNARLVQGWMREGVSILDPASTVIDTGVVLAPDAEIGPGTQLEGDTVIETGARIGPGCLLRDTTVGRDAVITHSVCESAVVGPGAVVGPFAHLPPGTRLGAGARVTGSAGASGTPTSEGVQQA
jgi:bifunctional UDP-N-acetylglucosamine pyrophosphorylase/glucosamine-1-phosphate N-acetyltransferase